MSYVFWKYLTCGVYLDFWDAVFVCVENDVPEDGVCSVYICWCFNIRKKNLVSVVNCVQFTFL